MENYMTVTTKNIDAVAQRMREMLTDQRYTVVHAYEYKRYKPEVRLHQQLEGHRGSSGAGNGDNISVCHHSETHAGLILCDTYGVGGFSTTQIEERYDPDFNAPYIVFEYSKIHIKQRAPNGLLYYVVYAVE